MKAPTIQPSKFDGWNTPPDVLSVIREFSDDDILLDPCSNEHSQVGARISLTKADDGLGADWNQVIIDRGFGYGYGLIFVNPPFDHKTLTRVTSKCIEQAARRPNDIILLAPVKSDQGWSYDASRDASAVCYVRGRVKFWKQGKRSIGAAFACALWYWGPHQERFVDDFDGLGATQDLTLNRAAVKRRMIKRFSGENPYT